MVLLASKSSGRLATLRAAGVEPLMRVLDVNEETVLNGLIRRRREAGLTAPTAAEQVQAPARARALDAMASIDPQEVEVVVGCDSMLETSGQVAGRPIDVADAHERWRMISGSSGTLHTGHFLVRTTGGAIAEGVSSATIRFGSPSRIETEAYIATGEPLWCAGAFIVDGLGGAFIEGIDGDPHGVVGTPLPLLRRLLADLDVVWTDLWAPPPVTRPTDGAH